MLSAFQIALFFDHQCLWKLSINLLDFLHGDRHQRKIAYEIATVGWVWSAVLLLNQITRFFYHQYLWNELISQNFLHGDNHYGKVACETAHLLGVASCASHPIRLQDSLIINICQKNQQILVFFLSSHQIEGLFDH